MSPIPVTKAERIPSLMAFGYTAREAGFLCTAALHGGFFLRRQYGQFIGSSAGGADAALVEKLLAKGHGTALVGCHKALVYHIAARPFYNAIGQEDNRNRRMRPPVSIKNRLMGLDYVLDHPGRYLATEQDKTSYFTGTLGVDLADLPEKPFRSPTTADSTVRFFVDKFPVFVREPSAVPPAVSFCFIDEGAVTLSRFEAYLDQYRRLLSRLTAFEVIYVAASRALFWEAERVFQAFVTGKAPARPAALESLDVARLLDHFQDRLLYETRPLDPSFDRLKLIRLRSEREQFAGAFFASLYRQWQTGGRQAVQAALAPERSAARHLNGSFSTCLMRHNYDLFGTLVAQPGPRSVKTPLCHKKALWVPPNPPPTTCPALLIPSGMLRPKLVMAPSCQMNPVIPVV